MPYDLPDKWRDEDGWPQDPYEDLAGVTKNEEGVTLAAGEWGDRSEGGDETSVQLGPEDQAEPVGMDGPWGGSTTGMTIEAEDGGACRFYVSPDGSTVEFPDPEQRVKLTIHSQAGNIALFWVVIQRVISEVWGTKADEIGIDGELAFRPSLYPDGEPES